MIYNCSKSIIVNHSIFVELIFWYTRFAHTSLKTDEKT